MLNKYFAVFRTNFLNNLVYFSDTIISYIISGAYILIFVFLWSAVSKQGSDLAGYSLAAMIWYLGMTQVIRSAQGKVVHFVSGEINSGNISNYLNKPYSYIGYNLAYFLSDALIKLVSSLFWICIVILFYFGPPSMELKYFPFILLSILLGILINFFITLSIGFLAFWFEDATPYSWVYDKIIFVLGGMLLPLEILPNFLQTISKMLPTAFVMYFPAKLFVNFSWDLFLTSLSGQIIYLIFFIIISCLMFKLGCKKVSINGG